jgi:hypothetical protein
MVSISKIENTFTEWLKPIPHLPSNVRKWLAENVWWIMLVGVIMSVFSALILLVSIAALGSIMELNYANERFITVSTVGFWQALLSVVAFLYMIIFIIVVSSAINPLRHMQKKGWDILFMIFLLSVAYTAIDILLGSNFYTFIPNLLLGFVVTTTGAYLINEIRSYFKPVKKA